MRRFYLLIFSIILLSACGAGGNKALDAKTRQAIDSISAEQIRLARIDLDSQCIQQRITELPLLVDSIRDVREKQIREKLKGITQ